MAEENQNLPAGGVPPANKVQPKKETVRINLPPKPSAAPTIKLPTLPPGGPSASAGFQPQATAAPIAAHAAGAPRAGAAPTAAQPTGSAPRPAAQRPAAAAAAPAMKGLDIALAWVAAIAGLVAVGSTAFCWSLFTDK